MKLILASNNAHKLREFRELFRTLNVELLSQGEAGIHVDPEETGETFAENAFIKAEAVMKASGLPAIADDSGLCVDALGGAPGVHSARYTGNHNDSDVDRYEKVLREMRGVTDRSARFVCSLCCVFPNGDTLRTEAAMEGVILDGPRGENGFGYDPIFQALGYDRSNSELSMEEKNAISHRGKALQKMKEEWEKYHADK
ncbi:MAG: RdgB/HAM1 family non-canonical purine NTP pyrophosphatase [Oscillospiraceae bacterium]|nr:RdgB/HAM1 family non-canonical purine NTP pyrophosphatase [Oscillospiraceae bacterium]